MTQQAASLPVLPHPALPPLPCRLPAVDALQNSAALAVLYLEGALPPDCPLVTFAPAGEMAQVRQRAGKGIPCTLLRVFACVRQGVAAGLRAAENGRAARCMPMLTRRC